MSYNFYFFKFIKEYNLLQNFLFVENIQNKQILEGSEGSVRKNIHIMQS